MDKFNIRVPDTKQEFETGAHRGGHAGKGRYDLLPWDLIERFAIHLERGAKIHEDRNWEKGIKASSGMDSLLHHAFLYMAGDAVEDHLAAIMFNVAIMIRAETLTAYGRTTTLLDLPAENVPTYPTT